MPEQGHHTAHLGQPQFPDRTQPVVGAHCAAVYPVQTGAEAALALALALALDLDLSRCLCVLAYVYLKEVGVKILKSYLYAMPGSGLSLTW